MDGPRGLESTDTIRGHEKTLFSCISCISWFQPFAALKHLAWLPFTCPSVVSHKSLVFDCSKNAPGQGGRTEPARSGL